MGRARERRVHFVEEILGLDEERPISVLKRLEEEAGGKSCLSHASGGGLWWKRPKEIVLPDLRPER